MDPWVKFFPRKRLGKTFVEIHSQQALEQLTHSHSDLIIHRELISS